jgi:hypothetical protein
VIAFISPFFAPTPQTAIGALLFSACLGSKARARGMTTSKLDACLAAQIWNQTTRVVFGTKSLRMVGVSKKLFLAGNVNSGARSYRKP